MKLKGVFRQLLRYTVVGVCSVVAYLGSLWMLLHLTLMPDFVANAIAYAVATLLNYVLNYHWSFSSRASHRTAAPKFGLIVLVGATLNSVSVAIAVGAGGLSVLVAATIFAAAWPLLSFSAQRFWAFQSHTQT